VALQTLMQHRAARGDFGQEDPTQLAERSIEQARDPAAQEFRRDGGLTLERFVPIPGQGLVITLTDSRRMHEAEEKIARMAKFPDENPGPVRTSCAWLPRPHGGSPARGRSRTWASRA